MLVPNFSRVDQVSSNARTTMSFSFAFTSYSFQKYSWRPCTHSKYETTTPPALASTSGRTRTPRSSRISSAAGVTGPLAPSQIIRALTRGALSSVITCSSAHGARTSHSISTSSSFVISSAPGGLRACRAPPCTRARPGRRCRTDWRRRPASPRAPRSERPRRRAAGRGSSRRCRSPGSRPASRRAGPLLLQRGADAVEGAAGGRLDPSDRAADRQRLPGDDAEHRVAHVHRVGVEDPGHHLPSVPTSGAGMSFSGPISLMISLV